MNDNDIIKALECCINGKCAECPLEKMACSETVAMQYALAFINRQKADKIIAERKEKDARALFKDATAEIARSKNKQKPTGASGYKIENGKVVFFTNMLNGYRYEYKDLDEVVKTLNELLQECYSKDEIAFALRCKTEELKTAKSEAIKEFAEEFERRCIQGGIYPAFVKARLNEIVKERVRE